MEAEKVDGGTGERGKIVYDAHIEKSSSPSLRRRRVLLTLIAEEDNEMLAKEGLACLRHARTLRLCREAHDQGTLLAYEDLTTLLLTSLSTIKRDVRFLKKQGLSVPIYRKKQRPTKGE